VIRRFKKMPKPMQYASGYSLDLYCDSFNARHVFEEFPHIFMGETFADCSRQARAKGWVLRKQSRTATCPKCTKLLG
jgi:hypothetical protein